MFILIFVLGSSFDYMSLPGSNGLLDKFNQH